MLERLRLHKTKTTMNDSNELAQDSVATPPSAGCNGIKKPPPRQVGTFNPCSRNYDPEEAQKLGKRSAGSELHAAVKKRMSLSPEDMEKKKEAEKKKKEAMEKKKKEAAERKQQQLARAKARKEKTIKNREARKEKKKEKKFQLKAEKVKDRVNPLLDSEKTFNYNFFMKTASAIQIKEMCQSLYADAPETFSNLETEQLEALKFETKASKWRTFAEPIARRIHAEVFEKNE